MAKRDSEEVAPQEARQQITPGFMAKSGALKESVSFVVRLWVESPGEGAPEWRWHLTHVQSGEQRNFRRLADLLEYVAQRSGVAPPELSYSTRENRR